jgi:hypothetical protein
MGVKLTLNEQQQKKLRPIQHEIRNLSMASSMPHHPSAKHPLKALRLLPKRHTEGPAQRADQLTPGGFPPKLGMENGE